MVVDEKKKPCSKTDRYARYVKKEWVHWITEVSVCPAYFYHVLSVNAVAYSQVTAPRSLLPFVIKVMPITSEPSAANGEPFNKLKNSQILRQAVVGISPYSIIVCDSFYLDWAGMVVEYRMYCRVFKSFVDFPLYFSSLWVCLFPTFVQWCGKSYSRE